MSYLVACAIKKFEKKENKLGFSFLLKTKMPLKKILEWRNQQLHGNHINGTMIIMNATFVYCAIEIWSDLVVEWVPETRVLGG